MSREMKHAYRALRAKDLVEAIAQDVQNVAILMAVIAGIAIWKRHAWIAVPIAVAAVVAVTTLAFRAATSFFERRISRLGYSEVELEEKGLA